MCYEKSSSRIDCIFLFKEELSLDIKRDSLMSKRNSLESLTKILKSSKLGVCPEWIMWSKIAPSLGVLTLLPVKGVKPRCSQDLTLKCLMVLP